MTYISCFSDFAFWVCVLLLFYILNFLMIKMLQYKMYPAGELRCPTTALVFFFFSSLGLCPWRAYVVTQALASTSVGVHVRVGNCVSTMFKFSNVCIVF